jgi:hypothetical protein
MNIRKHFALVVGISLPILMVAFVAASIYIPRALNHPKADFVYSVTDRTAYPPASQNTKYYLHHVQANRSDPVSESDFHRMALNPSAQSPEGYTVQSGDTAGTFTFFGSYPAYGAYYLIGHGASFKLNLSYPSNNYNYEFKFLGWVK